MQTGDRCKRASDDDAVFPVFAKAFHTHLYVAIDESVYQNFLLPSKT